MAPNSYSESKLLLTPRFPRQNIYPSVSPSPNKRKTWNCIIAEGNNARPIYMRGEAMISLQSPVAIIPASENNYPQVDDRNQDLQSNDEAHSITRAVRSLFSRNAATNSDDALMDVYGHFCQYSYDKSKDVLERENNFKRVKENALKNIASARKNMQDSIANMEDGSGEWQDFQKKLRGTLATTNAGVAMVMNCHIVDKAAVVNTNVDVVAQSKSSFIRNKSASIFSLESTLMGPSRPCLHHQKEKETLWSPPSIENRMALVSSDALVRWKHDHLADENEVTTKTPSDGNFGRKILESTRRRLSLKGVSGDASHSVDVASEPIEADKATRRSVMLKQTRSEMIANGSSLYAAATETTKATRTAAAEEKEKVNVPGNRQTWTIVERRSSFLGLHNNRSPSKKISADEHGKRMSLSRDSSLGSSMSRRWWEKRLSLNASQTNRDAVFPTANKRQFKSDLKDNTGSMNRKEIHNECFQIPNDEDCDDVDETGVFFPSPA